MSLKKQFSKSKPDCNVTFNLPEEAVTGDKEVRLVGEFNDWDWEAGVPMKLQNGNYTAKLALTKDRSYQFRYAIDNQEWENDWEADEYTPTPYGVENSVVRT